MKPNLNRGLVAHPPCHRCRAPSVAPDVPNDWHAPVDQLYTDMEAVLRSDASSCQVRQGQWEVSTQRLQRQLEHGDFHIDDLLTDGRRCIVDCKSECDDVLHDVAKRGRLSMPRAASEPICETGGNPEQRRDHGGRLATLGKPHLVGRMPKRRRRSLSLSLCWLSPAFVNDLPASFFGGETMWFEGKRLQSSGAALRVHGHTHKSVDYMVGHCRIVSNPRGYRDSEEFFENKAFDAGLIVEVKR